MTPDITTEHSSYPLPQPAVLRVFGKLFSYLFHPLFIPLYVSAYLIYIHPYSFAGFDERQKFLRLFSIIIITAFFPAITVFLLWKLKFANSILLRTQQERIIPYVASIIYFFWAWYVAKNLEGTPKSMVFFFLGIFIAVSIALMANNFFKISMHALAAGGAGAFMVLLALISTEAMGLPLALATIVTGIVCTSRLIVSDHHPYEIYWGLFVGGLSQTLAFYFTV